MEVTQQQDTNDETYFSADDSDVGSVDLAELLDTLGRHLQYCDLSQTKCGRVIICDKFSRFLNGSFEFHQDSEGYSHVLVPTPHHSGDSRPNTEGCPDAPWQTSYQDCEIDVRFKDCKYGDDLGIQPCEHVLLSITRAAIPPGIFNKLFSILEPEATIDVQITGANAEGVKKLMKEVGFEAEILYKFPIPVGSRLAQELETGNICTQDDLTREDDRGVHEKILDWLAAGSVSLCVIRGRKLWKKRVAVDVGERGPGAKRVGQSTRPKPNALRKPRGCSAKRIAMMRSRRYAVPPSPIASCHTV